MGLTKQLLEETWHEYASRIELHWMEQEYFQYIQRPKKHLNYETKLKVQEKNSCRECIQPPSEHGQDAEQKGKESRQD